MASALSASMRFVAFRLENHALPNGVKYVLLSHNTKMGAAKGCVLTAEMLAREGYIKR